MKNFKRLVFFVIFSLHITYSSAQLDPVSLIGNGIGIGKSIFGGIKDKKKAKVIQSSISVVQINGIPVSILRVTDTKVMSGVQQYVLQIQNQLDRCFQQYEEGKHPDFPIYNDDVYTLKSIDKNWPTEYYENEFKAYRVFDLHLTQIEKKREDSIETANHFAFLRQQDSLNIVRRRLEDSLTYANRVEGFYFINKDFTQLLEEPSQKSKVLGKLYIGSYIRLLQTQQNSDYVKVSMQDVEGYIDKNDLVDNIDLIDAPIADMATYKSRQYYKYEPVFTPVIEEESLFIPSSVPKAKSKKSKAVTKKPSYSTGRAYIIGPRGGCYYLTSSGTKVYVDHSYCR